MVSHSICPTFQVTVLQPLCALVGFAFIWAFLAEKLILLQLEKYAAVERAGWTNPTGQLKIELAML